MGPLGLHRQHYNVAQETDRSEENAIIYVQFPKVRLLSRLLLLAVLYNYSIHGIHMKFNLIEWRGFTNPPASRVLATVAMNFAGSKLCWSWALPLCRNRRGVPFSLVAKSHTEHGSLSQTLALKKSGSTVATSVKAWDLHHFSVPMRFAPFHLFTFFNVSVQFLSSCRD